MKPVNAHILASLQYAAIMMQSTSRKLVAFFFVTQTQGLIFPRGYTDVPVEVASDTSCQNQVCKHEVALHEGNHNRFSPHVAEDDDEHPTRKHNCLDQQLDSLEWSYNDH